MTDSMEPLVAGDRLPPELLSEIFINCWNLYLETDDCIPLHHSRAPLLLGQICSRWRRIAYYRTPQLWTELDVALSHCAGGKITFIQEWLARAGNFPLSITIKLNPVSHSDTNDLREARWQLAKVLVPFLTSTKNLCLQLPYQYFMALGVSIPAGGMPLLEHLDLTMGDGLLIPSHGVNWRGIFTISLEGCDNLRSLELESDGSSIVTHELISSVPWSRLVKLSLSDEHINAALACTIFHSATNLVECTLRISYTPDGITILPPTTAAVTHTNLRNLTIIFSEADVCELTPLLQITSPALEELVLHYDRSAQFSENPTDALLSLQDRSSFMLTKLELVYIRLPPFQLVAIFDNLPTLTSLIIQFGHILNQDIISALIYFVDLPPRLPNLTEFTVCEEDMKIKDDYVLDMIESRWTPGIEGAASKPAVSRLEEVTIFVEPEWNFLDEESTLRERPCETSFQRFKALLNAGLRIDFPRLSEAYWDAH